MGGPSVQATDTATVTVEMQGGPPLACNAPVVGFEDGAFPTGWSYTTLALPGGQWVVSMNNSSGFWNPGPAPQGVYYASANDDLPGSGSNGSADYLYTNIIDLSGYTSASLNFWYHFNGAYGQVAGGVEVSGDGGATWDGELILPTGPNWQTYSLDLIAYAGNNNVQVRFHSNDGGTWASGYAIDGVALACGQAGNPPNIDVDPLSMASTQAPNVQVQQTLTISNTGGGTLNWDIDEEPDTLLPVQVYGPMAKMISAQPGGRRGAAAQQRHHNQRFSRRCGDALRRPRRGALRPDQQRRPQLHHLAGLRGGQRCLRQPGSRRLCDPGRRRLVDHQRGLCPRRLLERLRSGSGRQCLLLPECRRPAGRAGLQRVGRRSHRQWPGHLHHRADDAGRAALGNLLGVGAGRNGLRGRRPVGLD
ncbi:MAG: hypothetical protein V9H69_10735 [Anaerolineae bacterium]